MKIADIEAVILREGGEAGRPREEVVLVAITTDEGLTGYGEANADAVAVKALLDSHDSDPGIRQRLIGEDPSDPRRLFQKLKHMSYWSYRSGVGHVAIAGVDMALWDLAGKIHDVPTWRLLGERRCDHLVPYITVWHGASAFAQTLGQTLETLDRAIDGGFKAAKVEALSHNTADEREIVALVEAARAHVGPDFILLLDVGYRWTSFEEAIECAQRIDELDLFALETPFPPENLEDHRRLAATISTPIATGDILTSAVEYFPLLDSGAVAIVQAGASRTGISDMDVLAKAARERGCRFVPWGWSPTTLTAAANLHLSVVHDNVPLIEYAPPSIYPESTLRRELGTPEPSVRDGEFDLPAASGLGIAVDETVVERLRVG